MQIYWPAVASSVAIITAIFRYLYIQWRDRRNLYSLFIEECIINYQQLSRCLPEESDGGSVEDFYPSVMSFAGVFSTVEQRFVTSHYGDLNKLSRSRIHTVMAIDSFTSQIANGLQEWRLLREKGDDRSDLEIKKTGAMTGLLYQDLCCLVALLEGTLNDDRRGKNAVIKYSKFAGEGVARVREYREITGQQKV